MKHLAALLATATVTATVTASPALARPGAPLDRQAEASSALPPVASAGLIGLAAMPMIGRARP